MRTPSRSLPAAAHVVRSQAWVGFETSITLNRKDFGLAWNAALETGGFLAGDEVRINLSIQAIAQSGRVAMMI